MSHTRSCFVHGYIVLVLFVKYVSPLCLYDTNDVVCMTASAPLTLPFFWCCIDLLVSYYEDGSWYEKERKTVCICLCIDIYIGVADDVVSVI